MTEKNKSNFSTKVFFIHYGIFFAFILLVSAVLVYTIYVSRASWFKNLKTACETVLEESEPGEWTLGETVELKNPAKTATVCYEAHNSSGENAFAVIKRIQTFYGPLTAVFVCTEDKEVSLKGFVSLHGRIKVQLESFKNNKRITYYAERIPEIIGL